MPHLYLVDGSGYIFRAYHRLPPLTNKHGEPVGAVYGYTAMLWKLADQLHKADGPTHMAVVLDKSSKTFRNDLYDQYKAHRPPPPEDLVPQFPMIRDATRAFSLPCIETEGLEEGLVAGPDPDQVQKLQRRLFAAFIHSIDAQAHCLRQSVIATFTGGALTIAVWVAILWDKMA